MSLEFWNSQRWKVGAIRSDRNAIDTSAKKEDDEVDSLQASLVCSKMQLQKAKEAILAEKKQLVIDIQVTQREKAALHEERLRVAADQDASVAGRETSRFDDAATEHEEREAFETTNPDDDAIMEERKKYEELSRTKPDEERKVSKESKNNLGPAFWNSQRWNVGAIRSNRNAIDTSAKKIVDDAAEGVDESAKDEELRLRGRDDSRLDREGPSVAGRETSRFDDAATEDEERDAFEPTNPDDDAIMEERKTSEEPSRKKPDKERKVSVWNSQRWSLGAIRSNRNAIDTSAKKVVDESAKEEELHHRGRDNSRSDGEGLNLAGRKTSRVDDAETEDEEREPFERSNWTNPDNDAMMEEWKMSEEPSQTNADDDASTKDEERKVSEESKNSPGPDENGENYATTKGCEEESDEGEPQWIARVRLDLLSLLSPRSKTITDDLEAALDKLPGSTTGRDDWLGLEFLVEHRYQSGEVGDEREWQSPEKGERAPENEDGVLENEDRVPENEEPAPQKEEQASQTKRQEQCEQWQTNDRRRFAVYYVCHLCGDTNKKITIANFAWHVLGRDHRRHYQRMVYPYFIAGEDTDISAKDVTRAAMARKARVVQKKLKQIIGRQKIIRNEEFVNGGLPIYIKNGKLSSEIIWKLKVALKVRSDEVGFTDIFEANMPKDEPMVGLEFITEKEDDHYALRPYICHLCDPELDLPESAMLEHLRTLKHLQNYKHMAEPQLEVFENVRTKMEIKESILKWALEHEAKMGRKSITRKGQLENGELPRHLRDKIINAAMINNVFDGPSGKFVNYYSLTCPSDPLIPSFGQPSKEPIVGLEFVTDDRKDAASKISYTCHLCDVTHNHASAEQNISHMISYKHRLQYVKAVDPQSLMKLKRGESKNQWQILLIELAKETYVARGWKSVVKKADIKDGALPAHILEWKARIEQEKAEQAEKEEENLKKKEFGKGGKNKFVLDTRMPKRMRLEPTDPRVDPPSPTHRDGRGILGRPPSYLALSQGEKSINPPSLPPPLLKRRSATLSLTPPHDERVHSSHPLPHSHNAGNLPDHSRHEKRSHSIGQEEKTHSSHPEARAPNLHYKEKSMHHQLYEERTPRLISQEERARPHHVERDHHHPHKERSPHRQLYHRDGRDHTCHEQRGPPHPPRHDERARLRLNHEPGTTDRHCEDRIAPPLPQDRMATYHKQKTPHDEKSRHYYRERSPFPPPPPPGCQRASASDCHIASPSGNSLASSDANNSSAITLTDGSSTKTSGIALPSSSSLFSAKVTENTSSSRNIGDLPSSSLFLSRATMSASSSLKNVGNVLSSSSSLFSSRTTESASTSLKNEENVLSSSSSLFSSRTSEDASFSSKNGRIMPSTLSSTLFSSRASESASSSLKNVGNVLSSSSSLFSSRASEGTSSSKNGDNMPSSSSLFLSKATEPTSSSRNVGNVLSSPSFSLRTAENTSFSSSSQTKEAGSFSSTPSKHTGSVTRMSSSPHSLRASGVTPSSSRNEGKILLSSSSSSRVTGNTSFLSEASASVSSSTTTFETSVTKDSTISSKVAESMPNTSSLSAFEDILALLRAAEGLSSSNSSSAIKDAPSSSKSAGWSSIPDSSSLVSKTIGDPLSSKSVGSILLPSSTMSNASRIANDPPSSSKLTGSALFSTSSSSRVVTDPPSHKSTCGTSFSTLSSKLAGNASLSTSFSTLSHAPSKDHSRNQSRDPPSSKSVGSALVPCSTMSYPLKIAKDQPSPSQLTGSAFFTTSSSSSRVVRDPLSSHKSTDGTLFSTLSSESARNESLSTSFSTLSHARSRDCSRDQPSSRAAKTTSAPSSSSAPSSWPSAPTVFMYTEGSARSDSTASTASATTPTASRKTNYDQRPLKPPSQSTAPSSKFSHLMLAVMNQQPAARSVDIPADGNPDNYAAMNKPVDNRRTNYSLMNVRGSSVDQTDVANIPKRTDSPSCIYLD